MNVRRLSGRALSIRSALLVGLASTMLFFGCRGGASAGGQAVGQGSKLPDLEVRTLDGKPVKLASYRGKVVVVDFWATWCGPCHLQAKILAPLHKEFEARGVQFIGLDTGEDPDTVKSFLKSQPLPYPVLLDPDNSASDRLGVFALPTVMVVDKEGRIVYLEPGLSDGPTLRQALKDAGV